MKLTPVLSGVKTLPICAQGCLAASGGSSTKPFSSLAASTCTSLPRIIPLSICTRRDREGGGRKEGKEGGGGEKVQTDVCVGKPYLFSNCLRNTWSFEGDV